MDEQEVLDRRALIAALAMQGVLASVPPAAELPNPAFMAKVAVRYADALLAELAK